MPRDRATRLPPRSLSRAPILGRTPRINRGIGPLQRLNRGSFFHAVYRTEEAIGKAILAAHPYRLYPPRQYFAGFFLTASDLISPRVRPR
jgi:hypothetical protein